MTQEEGWKNMYYNGEKQRTKKMREMLEKSWLL